MSLNGSDNELEESTVFEESTVLDVDDLAEEEDDADDPVRNTFLTVAHILYLSGIGGNQTESESYGRRSREAKGVTVRS